MTADESAFGTYLRQQMAQARISMRRLARQCGLDSATVWRLAAGRQRPRPEHLQALAGALGLPEVALWQAAGYLGGPPPEEEGEQPPGAGHAGNPPAGPGALPPRSQAPAGPGALPPRSQAPAGPGPLPPENPAPAGPGSLLPDLQPAAVAAELEKYRLFAQTSEGQELIRQSFQTKLDQLRATGEALTRLKVMHALYLDPATAPEQRHLLGSALLYFVLSTDIIPDYLFPIGYLDDALAIEMVWQRLQPPPVT